MQNRKGKYICFEGSEGVGKTTQVNRLVDYLVSKGFKVLLTKEPGMTHSPLTLELRKLILDAQYESSGGWANLVKKLDEDLSNKSLSKDLTKTAKEYLLVAKFLIQSHKRITTEARELIVQSVRSITLEKVVAPALHTYDYVIQDRGILSGLSYGEAGGVDVEFMNTMNQQSVQNSGISNTWEKCYDQIIILQGNVAGGLKRAQSAKKEFSTDDVMEKRGVSYLEKVNENFNKHSKNFTNDVLKIKVDDKSIDEVADEILKVLT